MNWLNSSSPSSDTGTTSDASGPFSVTSCGPTDVDGITGMGDLDQSTNTDPQS